MRYQKVWFLLFFLLMWSVLWANPNDSGKPGDVSSSSASTMMIQNNQAMPDYERANFELQAASRTSSKGMESRADREESMLSGTVSEAIPAWKKLENFDISDRQNASIQFEVSGNISAGDRQELIRIEQLWNSGDFQSAITAMKNFETAFSGGNIAVAVSWKTPRPIMIPELTPDGADVQIGTRTGIKNVVLDFHAGTGNLFAVLLFSIVEAAKTVGPSIYRLMAGPPGRKRFSLFPAE